MLHARGDSWLVSSVLSSRHGFSTRLGGVSLAPMDSLNLGLSTGDMRENVLTNRERAAEALGLPGGVALVGQVHGTDVAEVTESGPDRETADALWTRRSGQAIGILVADCTPILLEDRRTGTVAAVHAGWRGAVAGIAARVVQTVVREAAIDPGDLVAVLGPGIGSCCFEVGPEVVEALEVVPGGSAGLWHVPPGKERAHVDVAGISARFLASEGVSQVHLSGLCTACDPGRFFSHRRDRGQTGRMMGAIACRVP